MEGVNLILCFIFYFASYSGNRCWARPIQSGPIAVENVPEELYARNLGILLVALASVICTVVVVVGCLCCRGGIFKPFENFHNGRFRHAYVNQGASNEFTMFPPASTGQQRGSMADIKFEPLPDIRPRGRSVSTTQRPRPATFSNVINRGLSVQDWFEDPHANFPRFQLQYLQELGSGWFGKVVEGEAQGIANIPKKTKVVVKILREDATPTDQIYFLHEVKPFRDLRHPNIIKLLGKCLESDPFLIILEHCAFKDLKTYLTQHRTESESLIQGNLLLQMACNISAGLSHMHINGFIHTDLAARNCLVSADLQVKIGDYGNAIEKFQDNYYCAGDVAVPIRWCAPETLRCTETTIETKEVTTEANIWSFGVVLWEILEFGKLPYKNLHDEDVLQKVIIEKTTTLTQPETTVIHKDRVHQVMKLCWLVDPRLRPNMEKVNAMLTHLFNHRDPNLSSSFEMRWNSLQPRVQPRPSNAATGDNGKSAVSFNNNFTSQPTSNNPTATGVPSDWDASSSPSPLPSLSLENEDSVPSTSVISPSLQNLRGSLDDLNTAASMQRPLVEQTSVSEGDLNEGMTRENSPDGKIRAASEDLLQRRNDEHSPRKVQREFDAWLQLQQSKGAEASLMARQISEAIGDLDQALASEKLSSSESSHHATPERDLLSADTGDYNSAGEDRWTDFEDNNNGHVVTELVREKSQSIQDFLKLTVIDSDNSDSDTTPTHGQTDKEGVLQSSARLSDFATEVAGASLTAAIVEASICSSYCPPVSVCASSSGPVHMLSEPTLLKNSPLLVEGATFSSCFLPLDDANGQLLPANVPAILVEEASLTSANTVSPNVHNTTSDINLCDETSTPTDHHELNFRFILNDDTTDQDTSGFSTTRNDVSNIEPSNDAFRGRLASTPIQSDATNLSHLIVKGKLGGESDCERTLTDGKWFTATEFSLVSETEPIDASNIFLIGNESLIYQPNILPDEARASPEIQNILSYLNATGPHNAREMDENSSTCFDNTSLTNYVSCDASLDTTLGYEKEQECHGRSKRCVLPIEDDVTSSGDKISPITADTNPSAVLVEVDSRSTSPLADLVFSNLATIADAELKYVDKSSCDDQNYQVKPPEDTGSEVFTCPVYAANAPSDDTADDSVVVESIPASNVSESSLLSCDINAKKLSVLNDSSVQSSTKCNKKESEQSSDSVQFQAEVSFNTDTRVNFNFATLTDDTKLQCCNKTSHIGCSESQNCISNIFAADTVVDDMNNSLVNSDVSDANPFPLIDVCDVETTLLIEKSIDSKVESELNEIIGDDVSSQCEDQKCYPNCKYDGKTSVLVSDMHETTEKMSDLSEDKIEFFSSSEDSGAKFVSDDVDKVYTQHEGHIGGDATTSSVIYPKNKFEFIKDEANEASRPCSDHYLTTQQLCNCPTQYHTFFEKTDDDDVVAGHSQLTSRPLLSSHADDIHTQLFELSAEQGLAVSISHCDVFDEVVPTETVSDEGNVSPSNSSFERASTPRVQDVYTLDPVVALSGDMSDSSAEYNSGELMQIAAQEEKPTKEFGTGASLSNFDMMSGDTDTVEFEFVIDEDGSSGNLQAVPCNSTDFKQQPISNPDRSLGAPPTTQLINSENLKTQSGKGCVTSEVTAENCSGYGTTADASDDFNDGQEDDKLLRSDSESSGLSTLYEIEDIDEALADIESADDGDGSRKEGSQSEDDSWPLQLQHGDVPEELTDIKAEIEEFVDWNGNAAANWHHDTLHNFVPLHSTIEEVSEEEETTISSLADAFQHAFTRIVRRLSEVEMEMVSDDNDGSLCAPIPSSSPNSDPKVTPETVRSVEAAIHDESKSNAVRDVDGEYNWTVVSKDGMKQELQEDVQNRNEILHNNLNYLKDNGSITDEVYRENGNYIASESVMDNALPLRIPEFYHQDIATSCEEDKHQEPSTSVSEALNSVIIEDLDSPKSSEDNVTVCPQTKNKYDDDMLIVDTVTNEIVLLESERPRPHLAFVRQSGISFQPKTSDGEDSDSCSSDDSELDVQKRSENCWAHNATLDNTSIKTSIEIHEELEDVKGIDKLTGVDGVPELLVYRTTEWPNLAEFASDNPVCSTTDGNCEKEIPLHSKPPYVIDKSLPEPIPQQEFENLVSLVPGRMYDNLDGTIVTPGVLAMGNLPDFIPDAFVAIDDDELSGNNTITLDDSVEVSKEVFQTVCDILDADASLHAAEPNQDEVLNGEFEMKAYSHEIPFLTLDGVTMDQISGDQNLDGILKFALVNTVEDKSEVAVLAGRNSGISCASSVESDPENEIEILLPLQDKAGSLSPTASRDAETPDACYTPDWESDSETSSQSTSSTSGEFDCNKPTKTHNTPAKKSPTCEDEDDDVLDAETLAALESFQPSEWNKDATPTRSVLRSPEKKVDSKKSVSFKMQKRQVIYEYPKEEKPKEWEEPRSSWGGPYEPQFDFPNSIDWELGDDEIPEDIVEVEEFDDTNHNYGHSPVFHLQDDEVYRLSNIADDDFSLDGQGADDVVVYDTEAGAMTLRQLLEHYGSHALYGSPQDGEELWNSSRSPSSDFFVSCSDDPFKLDTQQFCDAQFYPQYMMNPNGYLPNSSEVRSLGDEQYNTSSGHEFSLQQPSSSTGFHYFDPMTGVNMFVGNGDEDLEALNMALMSGRSASRLSCEASNGDVDENDSDDIPSFEVKPRNTSVGSDDGEPQNANSQLLSKGNVETMGTSSGEEETVSGTEIFNPTDQTSCQNGTDPIVKDSVDTPATSAITCDVPRSFAEVPNQELFI